MEGLEAFDGEDEEGVDTEADLREVGCQRVEVGAGSRRVPVRSSRAS